MSNYSCGGGRGGGLKVGGSSNDFYGLPTFTNYINMGAQGGGSGVICSNLPANETGEGRYTVTTNERHIFA